MIDWLSESGDPHYHAYNVDSEDADAPAACGHRLAHYCGCCERNLTVYAFHHGRTPEQQKCTVCLSRLRST